MKNKPFFALLFLAPVVVLSAGCSSAVPRDVLRSEETSLESRALQMRRFETGREEDILMASAGVLQDMGYTLDETERRLGVIIASKSRDATQAGQVLGAAVMAFLGSTDSFDKIDHTQKINVAVVTRLSETGSGVVVRVNFQRLVWDASGALSRVETLKDPGLYEGFFAGLSKAVFLEEHKI